MRVPGPERGRRHRAVNCYRYTLTGTDNVGNAVSIFDDRQGRHERARLR